MFPLPSSFFRTVGARWEHISSITLILKSMLTPRIQTPQPKLLWWELISRSCLCAWISLWRTFATTLCKHAKSIPESCTYEYRISSMYDLLFCFTSGIWSGICKYQKYLWLWFGGSWQFFRFLRPHLTYSWIFLQMLDLIFGKT